MMTPLVRLSDGGNHTSLKLVVVIFCAVKLSGGPLGTAEEGKSCKWYVPMCSKTPAPSPLWIHVRSKYH